MRRGWLALSLLSAGCPSMCVAATTPVRTRRGEVAAGSVVVGDRVESVDVTSGVVVEGVVVQVRRAARECVALRWRGGELVCTPEHPLYSPERGDYRPASDWITGDARLLLIRTGESVEQIAVAEVEPFAGVREVVDLGLAAEPRNFVAAGVVVHNKSPADEPTEAVGVSGPRFTLTAMDRSRAFRLRICEDGEKDLETQPEHELFVSLFSWLDPGPDSPTTRPQLTVWLEDVKRTIYPNGDELVLVLDPAELPDSTCKVGLALRFERTDEAPDAGITVTWDATLVFLHVAPMLTIETE